MTRILFGLVMAAVLLPAGLQAQSYTPEPENLANRAWFQDAKFGLFVHWGVYSVLGVEEWVMQIQEIDKPTYAKLGWFFNPVEFDPEAWVLMAKDAGMKYITITAKHHDGFAMFDSRHTDWDIVDRTIYGKDVLAQLAEACREHDLRLFFYYSQLDWWHDDYYPRGRTGQYSGRPDQGDWNAYIDFMNAQLAELLTNYGDVAGIWFDGWWDRPDADWRLRETYDLIHRLQPGALIGSNHHLAPKPGEDFQMFEKDLPGHNTAGFSGESTVGQLPLETAETMARYWGFSLQDTAYKSSDELIRYLVRAAGYNSNFLLNVGPMPNGKIQPEFVQTLGLVGAWTERYGDSIYGTRGGPVPPQSWGVTTHKDNRVFVHVLDWQQDSVLIPELGRPIDQVRTFPDGLALDWENTEFGTLLRLPAAAEGPDRVVEITWAGEQ
jgi:alpha-L-fucosidase